MFSMSYGEARELIKTMRHIKGVRRNSWPVGVYVAQTPDGPLIYGLTAVPAIYHPSDYDRTATDWVKVN